MLQSRVGLRSLGKSTVGLYKAQSVPKTRLFSTNTPSDRDQQLDFAHLPTFWKIGTNLLFDAQERARYVELKKSGILPKDSFWSPVWTYICLENPILKKYGVTGADLLDGAKHSCVAMTEALVDSSFLKHVRGEVEQCDAHDFFSSVQAPNVYAVWRTATKRFVDTGVRFTLTSLKVTDVAIRNVMTKIVPGDVPANTEMWTDLERASYSEAHNKVVEAKTTQKEDTTEAHEEAPERKNFRDKRIGKVAKSIASVAASIATNSAAITSATSTTTTHTPLPAPAGHDTQAAAVHIPPPLVQMKGFHYSYSPTAPNTDYDLFPPGSVLAYVDVQFKARREGILVKGKDKSPDGKEVAVPDAIDLNNMWSFRACISGQVPLEWILVDINGHRAEPYRN